MGHGIRELGALKLTGSRANKVLNHRHIGLWLVSVERPRPYAPVKSGKARPGKLGLESYAWKVMDF